MGALWLLVYTNATPEPITNEFINKFLVTANRGPQYSDLVTKSSVDIYKNDTIKRQAKTALTRHNFLTYKRHHVLHGFHRMSVTDSTLNAIQPFQDSAENIVLMCNGELYNFESLISTYSLTGLTSSSDVEVLIPLYKHFGNSLSNVADMLAVLRGEFSLVITENIGTFDLTTLQMFAATDLFSTKSLYLLYNTQKNLYMIFTELKNVPKHILKNSGYSLVQFPSASYWSFQNDPTTFIEYFDFTPYQDLNRLTYTASTPDVVTTVYQQLRTVITTSVIERFSFGSDAYSAFLVSGGFDSSLILAITVKYLYDTSQLSLLDNTHVFTVSDCHESDDVHCAIELVDFLNNTYGTSLKHHVVYISNTTLITSKLEEIVYIVESFDTDLIIHSIFYYFLYTHITNNKDSLGNFTSILSGDGLDEYCGYEALVGLDAQEFQDKSIEMLKHIHKADLVKTDKLAGHFGYEARYPYLDTNVMDLLLNIHPSLKKKISFSIKELPIDKYIIRKAFDTGEYLHTCNLWRNHAPITNCITNIKTNLEIHYESVYTLDEFNDFVATLPASLECMPQTRLDMHLYKLFVKQFSTRTGIVHKRHAPLLV